MTVSSSVIKEVVGCVVAVPGDDVDTDRIMPARYLKCVTFEKIGQYVFQDERFDSSTGKPKSHPLNDPKHKGAGILVVNKNFGCGSSREHAPQGILRYGFKAIVGESFAEIFAGNCTAIGLPTVTAREEDIKRLMSFAQKHPNESVTVDLESKKVSCKEFSFGVEIREASRKMFLAGTWDTTGTLLAAKDDVRRKAENLPYMAWRRART